MKRQFNRAEIVDGVAHHANEALDRMTCEMTLSLICEKCAVHPKNNYDDYQDILWIGHQK